MRFRWIVLFTLLAVIFLPAQAPQADTKAAVAAEKQANAKQDTGRVFVYRYKQFAGSGLEPSIYADETQLARMDNGRYFVVELPAGTHTFRANDKQSQIELEVKAGQEYFIRVEIVAGFMKGHGRLVLTMPEQGRPEVKKLEYLGKDKIKDSRIQPPPSPAK